MNIDDLRKSINNATNREWKTFIVIAVVCLCVVIAYQRYAGQVFSVPSNVKIVFEVYDLSNECVRDHYDTLLIDGEYVLSFFKPEEDCDSEYLTNLTIMVTAEDPENYIEQQIDSAIKHSSGNAIFLQSCQLINSENGDLIRDVTDEIISNSVKEFLKIQGQHDA